MNTAEQLINFFNKYPTQGGSGIDAVYHPDICFIDPAQSLTGVVTMQEHLDKLYQNVEVCTFDLKNWMNDGVEYTLFWEMHLRHPKLNKGKTFTTPGCSHLKVEQGLIIYHRDYFDLGNMFYEQIPLMGKIIRFLKSRLGHNA